MLQITAAETLGVEARGAFYEETGALRDMVAESHAAIAVLTAMEPPVAFRRRHRARREGEVLRAIEPMTEEAVAKQRCAASTDRARSTASRCRDIAQEPNVQSRTREPRLSRRVEFHVDNWRWSGVPFYVRAGKRLAKSLTEVACTSSARRKRCSRTNPDDVTHNVISMRIQPNEGISLSFGARARQEMRAIRVDMDFSYRKLRGGYARSL